MTTSPIKKTYQALRTRPLGMRIFSAIVSMKAPYFRTIRPMIVSLEPGRGEARIRDRWGVHNHIGTVHAIACCNLAELVAGTTIDFSLPETHRWIPKGMNVGYLLKAKGTLTAVGTIEGLETLAADEARDVIVSVDVTDPGGAVVVHADITMWVTPRRTASSGV
ncbi:hotdog fold domain-containing protein [Microbacterium sp. LWO13-1.2]|uniref:hotdog fold domain-containing protein n=1 Tax=unclassified Microbacterium TaxID=2609290 RepID=UPI0031394267